MLQQPEQRLELFPQPSKGDLPNIFEKLPLIWENALGTAHKNYEIIIVNIWELIMCQAFTLCEFGCSSSKESYEVSNIIHSSWQRMDWGTEKLYCCSSEPRAFWHHSPHLGPQHHPAFLSLPFAYPSVALCSRPDPHLKLIVPYTLYVEEQRLLEKNGRHPWPRPWTQREYS